MKKVSGRFVWLVLLILLATSCGSATIATLSTGAPQPTKDILQENGHVPTPPLTAPITIKSSSLFLPTEVATAQSNLTPTSVITVETTNISTESTESATLLNVIILPTATPTSVQGIATQIVSQSLALDEIGLPATAATPDPLATISAQLTQPVKENALADPTETSAPPPMPANQAPLPVTNVAAGPAQIPSELPWDGVKRTVKVPILMYHYVSTPPPNADIYRKDLSVSPELFNAQLDRIQAEGYKTISLYDLLNHLMNGSPLPEKAVVITFDDGYRDNYESAFPSLKAHGMTATFFVVMEFINAQRPEYMTWDMLREMQSSGFSIEAHGVDHSSLKKRDRDFLAFQALRSYETLQNQLGQRARFISYPAGQYDQTTIDVFKSAGYWAGITTIQGATHSSDDLFEWRRVRVRGTTSADELANLLAVDW